VPPTPSDQTPIDDFNRADNPVNVGGGAALWDDPANFSSISTMKVLSNRLAHEGTGATSTAWSRRRTSGDFDLLIDWAVVTQRVARPLNLLFCAQDVRYLTRTNYEVGLYDTTGGVVVWKVTNGSYATIATAAGQPAYVAGETWWLARRGNVYTLYRLIPPATDFVVAVQFTDSSFDGGRFGFVAEDKTARWDSLRGGPTLVAAQIVPVGGVFPPGTELSITGQVVAGDGSLVGGNLGGQFGQVRAINVAQVFGVPSAQAFGTLRFALLTAPIPGVASAQAFGAVTIRGALTRPVAGIPSAQAFGALAIKAAIVRVVSGVGSAQAFGAIITRTGFSQPVGGVTSAQAFGLVRPANVVIAVGVGSAQAFSALKANYYIPVAGIQSAQLFGDAIVGLKVRNVWIWPTDLVPGTQAAPICGQVICGDGHVVGGWDYLPAAEDPETVELEPAKVETILLVPTVSK